MLLGLHELVRVFSLELNRLLTGSTAIWETFDREIV